VIGRRTFLALGAGLVVTACGSKRGNGTATDDADGSASESMMPASGFVVSGRFPLTSLTPGRVRLPVSLADTQARLLTDGPDALTATVRDDAGAAIASVSAARHGRDMLLPYWPFEVEIDSPGFYYLDVEGTVGGEKAFQIHDPSSVKVPIVGGPLAAFETPTTDDPRGVDPLCTRAPDPCPFHDTTLTAALASRKPVVYMVGTPAHCDSGTCAPGLEYLIDASKTYGDRAVFVHAEVYADAAATKVAPAVTASGLDYEPVIFVTDASGAVVDRIDIIWDAPDLAAILERAIA
jgi:hypothetical protein